MLSPFAKKDYEKVQSLIDRSEFKEALVFLEKARLPCAEQAIEDDLYFIEAFVRLLIYQGYQIKALPIIDLILKRLHTLQLINTPFHAKILIYKAQILKTLKKNSDFLSLYQLAYDMLENTSENQSLFGYIYLGLSQEDLLVNDWEMYMENALECFQRANNTVGEASALNAIGIYYGNLNDTELALDYFDKAMKIAYENHDLRRIAGILNNKAVVVYFRNEDTENIGLEHLQEATEISSSIDSLEFLEQHHHAFVHYFERYHQFDKVFVHLHQIFKIQEKRGILTDDKKNIYHNLIKQKKPLLDSVVSTIK